MAQFSNKGLYNSNVFSMIEDGILINKPMTLKKISGTHT